MTELVLQFIDSGTIIHNGNKKKMDPYTPLHRINSRWFKDLNVKYKIIKGLEDNTSEYLNDSILGKAFIENTQT